MTRFFEVHERDGAARIGELRLSESLHTPALVDEVRADAGSLWPTEREVPSSGADADGSGAGARAATDQPDGDAVADLGFDPAPFPDAEVAPGSEDALTILPHRSLPKGTPEAVEEAFAVESPDVDYPSAAVVSPATAAGVGTDAYVLANAAGYVGHAAAFVDALVAVREAIPADAALYLPGVATPRNVAGLAYAGVDLVDADRALVRGTQGRYLTTSDDLELSSLEELPCACPACHDAVAPGAVDGETAAEGPTDPESGADVLDRAGCATHNRQVLANELARVRRRIRAGRLRDYLEGQARQANWCTAVLRRLDQQWGYLEARTTVRRQAELTATTEDALRRVEIQRFADRVAERYEHRFADHPLVLLPCSARKPYSDSQSHAQFRDAIGYRGHVMAMTSPIGVVPRELELTYPAQHYDSVVTGHWSETELTFVTDVLAAVLADADYPEVIAHVPPEGYRTICERVSERVDLPVTYTVDDHPTTESSLGALHDALAGHESYRKSRRERATLRAVADYQFGQGAGEAIFEDVDVEGRYPQLRAHDADDGTQLAQLAQQYGLLALTLAGARRWREADVPTLTVEIDDFVPHGSVLAPGVVDASDAIRPGDEVLIEGPTAVAVGRAEAHGAAMVESTRGVACSVRHVEEV